MRQTLAAWPVREARRRGRTRRCGRQGRCWAARRRSAGAAGIGGAGACDDVAAQFLPAGHQSQRRLVLRAGCSTPGSISRLAVRRSRRTRSTQVTASLTCRDPRVCCSGTPPRLARPPRLPLVGYNPTSSENHYGGTVNLRAGSSRASTGVGGPGCPWSAGLQPSRVIYNVAATFTGLSGYGGSPVTTTDVHVLTNSAFSQGESNGWINVEGYGNTSTLGATGLAHSPSETPWTLPWGTATARTGNDSTGLSVQICRL